MSVANGARPRPPADSGGPASSERVSALDHAGLSRKSVEHSVDEFRARRSSEAFGESHRFLDRNAWRRLALHQFRGAQAEDGPFDRSETLETPVGGDVGKTRIELFAAAHDFADEQSGDPPFLGRDCEIVPDLGGDA